jgi:transcriptional regulator with XRE-family HTH domain
MIEARKNHGVTQTQLATRLNKPQSFVSKYERGDRRLDFVEFLEIANALEINIVEFINRFMSETS